jgi:hypothetical protein
MTKRISCHQIVKKHWNSARSTGGDEMDGEFAQQFTPLA